MTKAGKVGERGDLRPFFRASNGSKVLETRYLKKDPHGKVIESAEEMFRRVAEDIAQVDLQYEGGDMWKTSADEFYAVMSRLEFLPNSPTLMNAGRDLQQLSACFVLPVDDSLDSIFEAVKNTALIHKSGGGTGFSFSRVRPRGDRVRSTQGVASGPVSFMQVFDAATDAVKQGGTRRGANMGVLRVDHPDILEFIDAKSHGEGLANFNISVAVTDAFMEDAMTGTDYTLLHPRTGAPAGHLNAKEVFRRLCLRAWECGEPGMLFLDAINRSNPTPALGNLECTNPCGEQPLLPYESCNLGSINLSRITASGRGRTVVDYPRLARTVRTAVRFLDNVIDANHYPLPQIAAITKANRKIGLGVMGWADMLIQLGIPYDSDIALALAGKVMGFIRRVGHQASCEIAIRRGPFPNFVRCPDRQARGGTPRRNATITTIAPAGTISIIAGCSSGIEPLFGLSYSRNHVLGGVELPEIHPLLLRELAARGLDAPEILDHMTRTGSLAGLDFLPEDLRRRYVTALEIAPDRHVRMQAAFQKHSDNAVSKTVNLPHESKPEDVETVFRLAGELGCKGITVYRDRCRDTQVLNLGCATCA